MIRIVTAVLVSLALVIASFVMAKGLTDMRRADRFIVVKGLAEQLVPADTASWTLYLSSADDDLGAGVKRLQQDIQTVTAFFKEAGLDEKSIRLGSFTLTDQQVDTYGNTAPRSPRYIIRADISVMTGQVTVLEKLAQKQTTLIEKGVRITGVMGPNYYVNNLNAIKGDLLKTASQNGLQAAKDFAAATGARVGALKDAQQGVISISGASLGDNDVTQLDKRVRVVSTLSFYLD
jgi:hypothetical protein